MARFDTSGLDETIREMQRMGQDSGEVAKAMVNAAVIEIRDAWKKSAEDHGLRDTGAMIESIGFPAPVQDAGGILYRDVYQQGVDRKGTRNAEKAFVLHYGTSRVKPTYWVDDADAAAGPKVQERLEGIWGEFLETGKVPNIIDPGSGSTGGGITTTIKK